MSQVVEFAGNHTFLVGSFIALAAYLAFIEFREFTQKFSVITPAGAIGILNQENGLLIDVREASELNQGVISKSKHISLGSIKDKIKQIEKYKDKDVIVYCRSGHRSASACRTLCAAGFEKVYNLKGGIMAWQDAQLPVEKK